VLGLKAADFELRDSGVVQEIDSVTMEDVPLHLLLVLDTSLSVKGQRLAQLKEATQAVIANLRQEDSVSLLTFSQDLRLISDATTERTKAQSAVVLAESTGKTSLHDAVFGAMVLRHADTRRALMVVFSDGQDNTSWLQVGDVVDAAQRTDVVVYGVTPRPWWEADAFSRSRAFELRTRLLRWSDEEPQLVRGVVLLLITENTGGRLFYTDSRADLRAVFLEILANFKNRYLLTYTPENVPPDGWHAIDVKLKGVRADVAARKGYLR
jgi:VWFA-related protein